MELILASASPRRKALLTIAGFPFSVHPSPEEETPDPTLPPGERAIDLARGKAKFIAFKHPDALVIGADTVVSVAGEVLGKPRDEMDARRMLGMLSGKTHAVYTGCVLRHGVEERAFYETTLVTFYPLSAREIDAYIATGEPFDKAGAYGIQGSGCLLVKQIAGDFYNVMGLPIARLARALRDFDVLPKPVHRGT